MKYVAVVTPCSEAGVILSRVPWFLFRAFAKSFATDKHELPALLFLYSHNIPFTVLFTPVQHFDIRVSSEICCIFTRCWLVWISLPWSTWVQPKRCLTKGSRIWSEGTGCYLNSTSDLQRASISLMLYSAHNNWFWSHIVMRVFWDSVVLVVLKIRQESI